MTGATETRLHGSNLRLAYRGLVVAEDLSIGLPDGQVTTIVGPNACGKSTLLRAMGRLLRPGKGAVYLDGQAIQSIPTKEVARRLGLLSQQSIVPDGITVEDLARRGRFPHQGFFQPPSRADHEAVERALQLSGVEDLRYRPVDQLSGGQRQRAWIAMALAQDTSILLLDEPTTYLDIAHQHEVLELVRKLNRDEGRTIVMVLHDINEAAAVSDRIVAMRAGVIVADGPPSEVVTPEALAEIFGVECDVIEHPLERRAVSIPRSRVSFADPGSFPTPGSGALAAAGVTLRYGRRTAVDDLSVMIPEGRITAIIGPNACGKSTLLRAFARLITPSLGQATLGGRDVRDHGSRDFARQVSVLPQSPAPPPDVLVEDLVAAGRYPYQRWFRQWNREDEAAVAEALAVTGAEDLRFRPVEQLSGGQRQRVFLAMTLSRKSEVLLLDEPTTFLDIAHQVEVLDLVARANAERGATVVMVLHDLTLAARYAHHLVAMKDGQVAAAGPPIEVVTETLIRDVFGVDSCVITDQNSGKPLVLPAYKTSGRAPGPLEEGSRELR